MTVEAPMSLRRGRPPCCSRELAEHIVRMRLQGLTYGQICIALNATEVERLRSGTVSLMLGEPA